MTYRKTVLMHGMCDTMTLRNTTRPETCLKQIQARIIFYHIYHISGKIIKKINKNNNKKLEKLKQQNKDHLT